jgi:hypothetical protein
MTSRLMAGTSSRRGLTELELIQVVNEILDNNVVEEYSSDKKRVQMKIIHNYYIKQYMKSVTVNTKVMVIVILKDKREGCEQHFYGATSQHLPVQGRSFVMFVDHSSTLAVTWVLWMCLRSSLT